MVIEHFFSFDVPNTKRWRLFNSIKHKLVDRNWEIVISIHMNNFIDAQANYAYQIGNNQTRVATISYNNGFNKGTSLPLVDLKSRAQLLL